MPNRNRTTPLSTSSGNAGFCPIPICKGTSSPEESTSRFNKNITASATGSTLGIDGDNLNVTAGVEGNVAAIARTAAGVNRAGGDGSGGIDKDVAAATTSLTR